MAGRTRSQAAFSLLELLLVAVILGVGLLGLLGLQVAALRGRGAARYRLGGLALASSTLEQVLGQARLGLEPVAPGGGLPGPDRFYALTVLREPGVLEVQVAWPEGTQGAKPSLRTLRLRRQVPR